MIFLQSDEDDVDGDADVCSSEYPSDDVWLGSREFLIFSIFPKNNNTHGEIEY